MERRWLLGACVLLYAVSQLKADEAPKPAEYGTLKGRFVWDGEVPKRKEILPAGKVGAALMRGGHLPLLDESFVVDPKTKGVANVCIWLLVRRGKAAPKSHPSYDTPLMEGEPATTIKLHGARYIPHIAVARTHRPCLVTSNDALLYAPIFHTIANPDPLGGKFPAVKEVRFEFAKPERLPMKMIDAPYPWMTGWLIVQDHPYVAVSDAQGRFEIANIPIGKREFQVWHERVGYVREVTLAGKRANWPRGRIEVELTPAGVDLGEIFLGTDELGP